MKRKLTEYTFRSEKIPEPLRFAVASDIHSAPFDDVLEEFFRCDAVLLPGDKVLVLAPFFMEYRVFTEAAGGVLLTVPPLPDMQPDLGVLSELLDEKVRLVIINSPNNPSGVALTDASLRALSGLLSAAERKYGRPIYLLSDEPYRELLFDGRSPLCAADYYDNTVICYSYSKSLSMPGERIGYLAVSSRADNREAVFDAGGSGLL